MRQDAINDTMVIVVEPGDERSYVLTVLTQLAGRRVIVALPNDAVFRRPGDLRELKQVASHAEIELILVIAHNESLRLWARRQGFTVFSSVETSTRAQQPTRLSLAARSLLTEELVDIETNDHSGSNDNELQIEDVLEETYPQPPIVFPKDQFKVPGAPLVRHAAPVTEPLYRQPTAPLNDTFALSQYNIMDTPADVQLVDVQKALYKQIEEEKAQDYLSQPFSLLPEEQPLTTVDLPAQPTQGATHSIWPDRFLFVLVALFVLGIMGGIGFSYLLSLAHSVPAIISPASLTPGLFIYQVVH